MLGDWEPLHFTKHVGSPGCLNDRVGIRVCGVTESESPFHRIRAHRYEGVYFSSIWSQWLMF